MVYEPKEDSEFLASYVREHATGRVLDMGTGSGIQALEALESDEVKEVVAADVDPEAVRNLESSERLTVLESDMFSNLKDEKFDTIICNPPYLPDDSRVRDVALDGGPGGFEFIMEFLKEAGDHLNEGGQILLLFSSLTNKERVDRIISDLGYTHRQLGELAMFFERLYVYRVVPCD